MNLLHDFKNKPFIDAVQSFFKNLNVPFNVISKKFNFDLITWLIIS